MKKIFQLLAVAVLGATLLYSCEKDKPIIDDGDDGDTTVVEAGVLLKETFGTTAPSASPYPTVTAYTGYATTGKGAANVAYEMAEGTGSIRTPRSPSSGYANASGGSSVMFGSTSASAFVVKNIASCGAQNLKFSFGSNQMSDTVAVSYSADNGTTWTPLTYSKTDDEWGLVSDIAITLPPGTTCFALKFDTRGFKTPFGTRIDDIVVKTDDVTGEAAICGGEVVANFDVPEIGIDSIRARYSGADVSLAGIGKKVVGVVISDREGNNSTALQNFTIAAVDNSTGIMVRAAAAHTFDMNDKVEILLDGATLTAYGKALQLGGMALTQMRKVGTESITPRETSIAEINSSYASFESTLATVVGTVTSPNGNWGASANQNDTITKDAVSMISFVARNATFINDELPPYEVKLTGIVGRYEDAYQINIRNLNDVIPSDPNAPILQITSAKSATGAVDVAFSHTFTTREANLTGTTTFAVTNGTLPDGLSLSGATISGTPTAVGQATLTITATNGSTTAKQTFTINIKAVILDGLTEDFETMTGAGAYAGADVTFESGQWHVKGYTSMDNNDRRNGERSVRLRGNATDTEHRVEMKFDKTTGAGVVAFKYGSYSSHSGGVLQVQISTDGGATWANKGTAITAPSWSEGGNALQDASVEVNQAGTVRVRIIKTNAAASTSVNVDDVQIGDYSN